MIDPDFSIPVLDDEETDLGDSGAILGGDDDPDHPAYSNPTSESFVTEVSSKPMAIVGGTDDPDHTRLSLFLGGEDDPDHSRFSQDDTADSDDETTFGEQSDPDQDTRVTTDLEENEMADYPGKFGE